MQGEIYTMKNKSTILIVLAFALVFSLAAPLGNAAAAETCSKYHTIVKGETLAIIAAKYNTTWRYLAELNNIKDPNLIYSGNVICVATSTATSTPKPTTTPAPVPSFDITAVVADKTITIKTASFPAGYTFNVLWGPVGNQGKDGIKSGTLKSGSGGEVTATLDIPAQVQGMTRIAVRLESTSGGFFSYNWFNNTTRGATPTTPTSPSQPTAAPLATFSIVSVVEDKSVTIKTANFPANKTYTALMGAMGTRGVDGIKAGTVESAKGGELTFTINIPAQVQGMGRIAIRLESTTGGYFSYNWFHNNTTP
jgi:hypothetical protein